MTSEMRKLYLDLEACDLESARVTTCPLLLAIFLASSLNHGCGSRHILSASACTHKREKAKERERKKAKPRSTNVAAGQKRSEALGR